MTLFCRRASCSFTVEVDTPGTRSSAVLLRISPSLSASSCDSQDDLASCTSGSCESRCEFASRTHAVSESRFPFYKADPLVFMHIAFSMNSASSVSWRKTAFDLAVHFVERASNCTKILHPENVSKYFGMALFLLVTSRVGFLLSHLGYPSDSQQ